MGQLVGCIAGIAEAAKALDFPIVSGNVSLYNETMGVGDSADPGDRRGRARRRRDEDGFAVVQGRGPGHSSDRRRARLDRPLGVARRGRRAATRARRRRSTSKPRSATANCVAALIAAGRVTGVQDLSDGGLAVALAEMAMAGGVGATVALDGPEHLVFFGEDQGRYVVTTTPDATERRDRRRRARRRAHRPHRRHRRRRAGARALGADRACRARRNLRELVLRADGASKGTAA